MADIKQGKIGYTLQFSSGIYSPIDNTTYYIGMTAAAPNTTEGLGRVYIPKTGIIKRCYISIANGVPGTSETSTLKMRLNNTTDTLLSDAVVNDEANKLISSTTLSISVTQGDFIELKWVTPLNWVGNPTAVIIGGVMYIE